MNIGETLHSLNIQPENVDEGR